MTNLMKYLFFTISLFFFTGGISLNASVADRIKGSIFGALIGDCLGKPTEFLKSTMEIFKKFSEGITSFEDLKKFDLTTKNPQGKEFAMYTDDTAMARVTLKVLLESKKNNWGLHYTMGQLALAYAQDAQHPFGWHILERAPGTCCINSIRTIANKGRQQAWLQDESWWQVGGEKDGGCGSVMRAHPFGIVFADEPEKAAMWAAEHSKITHGHPMAIASCAAMAIGVAYAIQGKDVDFIIQQMSAQAKKYDPVAMRSNPCSKKTEKSTWGKIADVIALAQQHKKDAALANFSIPFRHHNNYLNPLFSVSAGVFKTYQGWAADDAIAAAIYLFVLTPNDAYAAISLGVHTPGDSDSIASMAGALVGATVGYKSLQKKYTDMDVFEGSKSLNEYADQAAQAIQSNSLRITKAKPNSGSINHSTMHISSEWPWSRIAKYTVGIAGVSALLYWLMK